MQSCSLKVRAVYLEGTWRRR
uniref:Uncharacterized protein n=1 Tax=Anguilla anguilla TaxID=7936 RepID=A0A0E9WCT6_ANGAN